MSRRGLRSPPWSSATTASSAAAGVWGSTRKAWAAKPRQPSIASGSLRASRQERLTPRSVFDGDDCLGWCQFGPPGEVPRIKNRAAYEKGRTTSPDWRIACCYVGKGHRRQGVATAALAGAVDLIADLGGGTVEGYPEDAGSVPAGLPLPRGPVDLRTARLRPRPPDRQAPLGRDEGGRTEDSRRGLRSTTATTRMEVTDDRQPELEGREARRHRAAWPRHPGARAPRDPFVRTQRVQAR